MAVHRALLTARAGVDFRREIRHNGGLDTWNAAYGASQLREVAARLCQRMRVDVQVQGPIPSGPCIVVSNHMSYIDPLAIAQVLPLSAVAKSEINGWPVVGEVSEECGVVFVRRGNAWSGAVALRKAMRILDAGVPVLVFPEGTTTVGKDLLPFARGAFGIARIKRVPVVPATLCYESSAVPWVGSASFLPHFMNLHRQNHVRANLTFGPRLEPMAFPDVASLADATHRCIRTFLVR